MKILLKYTIKSILEKKLRSFLIILAIALSGALFLASTRLSDSIGQMYEKQMKETIGNAEIQITSKIDSPSTFISENLLKGADLQIDYSIPVSVAIGEYKVGIKKYNRFSLYGFQIEDYIKSHEWEVISEQDLQPFVGDKLILTKQTAQKYGFRLGDRITLKINKVNRQLTICAIVKRKGLFKQENTGGAIGIIPQKTLSNDIGGEGKPNLIYVKINKGGTVDQTLEKLAKVYPRYKVDYTIAPTLVADSVSWIVQPLYMMTIMVAFISIFIIYTSFKVIMLEKMPMVGTFRSVGASRRMMNGILFLETLLYGIIGGVLGCFLGIVILYLFTVMLSSTMYVTGTSIEIKLTGISLLSSFLLSNTIAIVSTILPIWQSSKCSLKEIILNQRVYKQKKEGLRTILGILGIIIGYLIAQIEDKTWGIVFSVGGALLILIGVIQMIPMGVYMGAQLTQRLFQVLFGNIGSLASKNIRRNKSVINSVTLLALGMSILLLISTLAQNLNDQIIDFYTKTFRCDLTFYVEKADQFQIRKTRRQEGVQAVMGVMSQDDVECPNLNLTIANILGIEDENIDQFLQFNIEKEASIPLRKLQKGRNILVTKIMQRRYGLKEGDSIKLKFGNQTYTYTIIGFMDTMWNDGRFGIVSLKYLKKDANKKYYDWMCIKTKKGYTAEETASSLSNAFEGQMTDASTVKEKTENNAKSNQVIMMMISSFAILAMLIGIIGVINNLLISFIERKQNLAMLRSIGMSRRQILKMIFIEGVGIGFIGGSIGVITGFLLLLVTDKMLFAMQLPIYVEYVPKLFGIYLLGGLAITVSASILPARSAFRLNLIEAIKYE